ncbi:MAG: hypothetical protein EHM23_30480 [Acidobacteria bacterium]|nr:MAG: hypothetical protein EHM23_30480 [Acidobacteriota bacterium]
MAYQQGATIVSLFPEEISEPKPGLYPGYFVIPAAPTKGLAFLPIGDSVYYQETKNDIQTQVRVPFDVVAESIVGDFQRGHIGRIPDIAEPGLFWVPGQYEDEGVIRSLFGEMVLSSEQKQLRWFEELVKIADDTFSRTNRHSSVSHLQRMAATRLAVSRPWVLRTGDSDNTCVYCKSEVPFGAVKCPVCREIIDMVRYREMVEAMEKV